jgi:hypothetical protein
MVPAGSASQSTTEAGCEQSIRTPPIRNGLRHCSLWLAFNFPDSSNAISTNDFTGEPGQATRCAAKSISGAAKISPVTTSTATAAPVRPSHGVFHHHTQLFLPGGV